MPETAGRVLALLRGVNVAGRSMLSMAELKAQLDASGLPDVRTHLNSGNLLLLPGSTDPPELAPLIQQVIRDRFDLEIGVIIRTREELEDVVARNPLLEQGATGTQLHGILLAATPDETRVADLDPDRSPPDRFVVSGKEIFVHYPRGSGRSKLNLDYFERKLGVIGTARNWNTMTRLLEMLS
ncbi:MAG TPA: DUF1697 domain-containing protein [Acidimicrobiia bacterium]|nr:DUF1697 domain-containing protein [Acidimicrobiia bacterium]